MSVKKGTRNMAARVCREQLINKHHSFYEKLPISSAAQGANATTWQAIEKPATFATSNHVVVIVNYRLLDFPSFDYFPILL